MKRSSRMFFTLSKVMGFITLPSNAIACLCAVGALLLLMKWQRLGTLVVTFGVLMLLLVGYSPLANVLMLPLSERFPAWQSDGRDPDGIIVLGGAIDSDRSVARQALELDAAGARLFAMLDLAKRYPKARIVFTGGSGNMIDTTVSEAPIAGQLLESFGVAADRIVLESASRTTDENAVFTRRLVAPTPGERWLLVTSAFHMPRAIGTFRAVGFDVEAYPVDWRTSGWSDAALPFAMLGAGLMRADVAVHEWFGLVAYRLAGRSNALFPGPKP